jgi:hypothetical protein
LNLNGDLWLRACDSGLEPKENEELVGLITIIDGEDPIHQSTHAPDGLSLPRGDELEADACVSPFPQPNHFLIVVHDDEHAFWLQLCFQFPLHGKIGEFASLYDVVHLKVARQQLHLLPASEYVQELLKFQQEWNTFAVLLRIRERLEGAPAADFESRSHPWTIS